MTILTVSTRLDLFEANKLRDLWYDVHGLLKPFRLERPIRPPRGVNFAARVAAGFAMSLGVATAAIPEPPLSQLVVAWPGPSHRLSARESLDDSLKSLRTLKADWNNRGAPAPIERAISAAQYILGQIPDIVADARAGVDADGNVFLRIKLEDRAAYLTIEPKAMHLLYMQEGQSNIYVDEEPFTGKVIPASIKRVLDERLST